MIESVAGAVVRPSPPPRRTICAAMTEYSTDRSIVLIQANDAAIMIRPRNTMALVPIRLTASWVPRTEPTAIDRATGRMRTPVSNGPQPCSICMNWMIRKMNPKSAKNATVTAPLAALNRRLVNRVTSMSGSACRRSHTMKPMKAPRARAKPASVSGEDHPRSGASMIV